MARTLVQCAEPVKAIEFLRYSAPACVIESPQAARFIASLEKQVDQYFSDEKYVERYAGYTNEVQNPIEPFSDVGLLNLFRAQTARQLIEDTQAKTVLDIGAGDCTLDKAILEDNDEVKVDISELLEVGSKATTKLQELFPNRVGVAGRFDVGDVEVESKYDVVLCLEVIEHVTQPVRLLKNIKNKLTENGFAVISTPNHLCWIERKLLDQFGDTNWYHHVRAYTAKTLAEDALEAGLIPTVYSEPSGTLLMICKAGNVDTREAIEKVCTDPQELNDFITKSPIGTTLYTPFKLTEKASNKTLHVVNGIILKDISEKP
jgi:2-polyprenyl-3-methyl-5-hydroxy-6-metoxy-1,4-benzoquinol methylase